MREFMEPRFARDVTQVRVHDDDRAGASGPVVGALERAAYSKLPAEER